MMEPILRGLVKYLDDGRMVWEGRWGMTPSAFEEENQAQELNGFRYVHGSHVQFSTGDVVSFRGHFEVSSANKGSKSQFTDKELQVEVVGNTEDNSAVRTIQGRGSNRFGTFTLTGTFDPNSRQLEVRRLYAPKPVSTPGTSAAHAAKASSSKKRPAQPSEDQQQQQQQAHSSSSASSTVSSPPSSPSSPTDVAVTSGTSAEAKKLPVRLIMTVPSAKPSDFPHVTEVKAILKDLKGQDINKWFSSPVDAEALGLRDYHSVVKSPMDLGTIQTKLDSKSYATMEECFADMRLTFDNALMYNPRGSPVYRAAADLMAVLENKVKQLVANMASKTSRSASKTPIAIPLFEASSIGKRNRVKKKFFEPGEDNAGTVVSLSSANNDGLKSTKKKLGQQKFRASTSSSNKKGRSHSSGDLHNLASYQPFVSEAIRSKKRARPFTVRLPNATIDLATTLDPAFGGGLAEDDEGAESFDELDMQKPGDELFMTPPASEDEGEDDEDIPLSAIPLPMSSTPEFSRITDFAAMSPTNLTLEDDL